MVLEHIEGRPINQTQLRSAVFAVTCVHSCRLRCVYRFVCGLGTRPLWAGFMGSGKVMLERVSIDDPDTLTKAATFKLPLSKEVSNLVQTQSGEPTGFCG
jgi:hypothetical protein